MKNLKINVPEGYEIDKEKSTFENIVFKEVEKDITERIRTLNDAAWYLGVNDKDVKELMLLEEVGADKKNIDTQKLFVICKALNEGKIMMYDEKRYHPYFKKGNGKFMYYYWRYYHSCSAVGARLSLKDGKRAKYCGEQFIDLWESVLS